MKKVHRILSACILLLFLLSLFPMISAATSATCAEPVGKGISIMSFNVLNNNSKDSSGNFLYAAPSEREKASTAPSATKSS